MRQAFALLALAAERFPVAPNRGAHALTLNGEGAPLLTLRLAAFHSFTLDPADMDRDPVDILDEISRMLAGLPPAAHLDATGLDGGP